MVTSRLTRLECRVKPLREGDAFCLHQYEIFFSGAELIFAEVSTAVIETATELRARYNLKTPDALHFATAIQAGATLFLAGDQALSICSELPVELV
jgi:predicted nucleic acid-binding protein